MVVTYNAYTIITLSIKFIWLQKRYKIKSRKSVYACIIMKNKKKYSLFKEKAAILFFSFLFLITNIPLRT